ncbi:lysophospholipid acyltransferase family protein [Holospora curviuscula]|uniref:2-acyl-glycerophospho-ethanolamine acyltransferase n=1 Tax=Holospora curviuscula TaxID=1082868 RepID=A0A2S5R965_9PROT|nr:lysophospholipid acyltransferase family protein [Holospora curviuscula]PPE03840.1 2-acyl-glycerophospho-ethanolamine acyltransferase [Holospora curviuscula]
MNSKSPVLRFKQSRIRALFRMGGVCLLLLSGVIIGMISWVFPNTQGVFFLKKLLYRGIRRCAGINKVIIQGVSCTQEILAVSNHLSYLDIMLLGEQVPYVFVAKKEVKAWPLIGWIARQLGTIFIQRTLRGIREGQKNIRQSIQENKPVLVFAEGTTGNGILTELFYQAFFELSAHINIQPISICYVEINGFPALSWVRRHLSWIGDAALFPHLFQNLGWRSLTVAITFHSPFAAGSCRKRSAARAAYTVRCGISKSLKIEDNYA